MAIYHLSVKMISRTVSAKSGKGGKAVASAAYRSGQKLRDERNQETHDYTRKQGVIYSAIMAPEEAPDWARDREGLWNEVERVEDQSKRRATAQLARDMDLALPRELDHEQQVELLRGFVAEEMVAKGMVADLSIHDARSSDGATNPHAHIMLTLREIGKDGFGLKVREWNRTETLEEWRAEWSAHCNAALDMAGSAARIDHRTLQEQGIMREPGQHLGREAVGLAQRGEDSQRAETQASAMDRELAPYRRDIEEHGMISMSGVSQSRNWWQRTAELAVTLRDRVREGLDAVRDRWQQWMRPDRDEEPERGPTR